MPPIPAGHSRGGARAAGGEGVAPLHAELMRRDPASAARLMPGDRARITRALEVVLATGRSLTDWHRDGMPPPLDVTRARSRSSSRPSAPSSTAASTPASMPCWRGGALDEVRALAARGLDPLAARP